MTWGQFYVWTVRSINNLNSKVHAMANELSDLDAALAGFKAEVSTDIQQLLDRQTAGLAEIADLKAQLAASGTGIDAAAIEARAVQLIADTKAIHEKLNPPPTMPPA